MAALVRADSTESIPEADPTPEYDVVPIAAEYILRVIEGGKMKEAAYKLQVGKALWYQVFRQYKDFIVE